MENEVNVTVNSENLTRGFREASAEINRIATDEIIPAAAFIEDAFSAAARSIASELGRAARTGELSLKSLSRAIARDLGRVAIDSLVRQPIQNALQGLFSAPFGGGRANGGFVAPGASFLVGERGPELFTPSLSGRISGTSGVPVNVNITLPGVRNPDGFRQTQTQIAAMVARSLGRGQRNS